MKLLRFAGIILAATIATQSAVAQISPGGTGNAPAIAPGGAPIKKSVKNPVLLLHGYVGTWRGKMNIMNVKKEVKRTLDVVQTYKWEKAPDGARDLVGECIYSATAPNGQLITVKIVSRTSPRKDKIISELTQDGKTESFEVIRDENDFLVFKPTDPAAQSEQGPNKLTATQIRKADGKTFMEIRGYERLTIKMSDGNVQEGAALLEATLEKDTPQSAPAAK